MTTVMVGDYPLNWSTVKGSSESLDSAWFIHGMLEDANMWKNLAKQMSAKATTVPTFPLVGAP